MAPTGDGPPRSDDRPIDGQALDGSPDGSTETGDAEAAWPVGLAPPPPPPKRHHEDRFIGDFRLVRTLGEGGMGIVYEAEQQHPRRPVALKVIRGGAHVSSDTLKLFQREAQTLARLRHPGIAALYETGATDDGLHFFAMELVRGSTLSAWIRHRPAGAITPEELRLRLSVFKKICDAVAYAHQRGVIHRDLKPGNVLIPKTTTEASFRDSVPDVKVLDFGLARITDSDVQATTYVTEMGKVQGTLPYMSPEQVRGNPDEIDLRTDVYSLGVLLYEMVTGRLPYDVSKAQIPEAVRIICESSPKSMSSSFTGTKQLHGDVITIVGKCLEKEPSRRYPSAAHLGEDVQRYLSDQPILARPPSAIYQFGKFASRHRGAVAFGTTVFVLVTALALTSTIQAIRVSRERDRANQEAQTAKQISGFLAELFEVSDPGSRGNDVTAREILDRGAEKIDRELRSEPIARGRLLAVMGRTYLGLGIPDRADALLGAALEAQKAAPGSDTADYATTLVEVAALKSFEGRHAESGRAAAAAVEILERQAGPDDPRLFKGLYYLAGSSLALGDWQEARKRYDDLLRRLEKAGTSPSVLEAWCLNDLGIVAMSEDDLPLARRYQERALDVRERLFPPGHTERLQGQNNLADVLRLMGDLPRARQILEDLLPQYERVYGPDHVNISNPVLTLAEIAFAERHLGEARLLFERGLRLLSREGIPRLATVPARFGIARVAEAEGRWAEAEPLLRDVIGVLQEDIGRDAPDQIAPAETLARVLRAQGRTREVQSVENRIRELEATGQRAPLSSTIVAPTSRF